ncbi:MAG: 4-hydroxythreonine-4-phosphate dehydrogenase PdxA, partial [Chthoniobacterales bacterium]
MSTRTKARIGITLGDPAGIGPEIIEAALRSGRLRDGEFIVIGDRSAAAPGKPTRQSAQAAFDALEEAITRTRRDELDAVVTGPIHKARMYEIGFQFPGQTEFFAERCGVRNFAMCLTGGNLTVALVTTHISLAQVPQALRTDEIVRVGLLLRDFLICRGKNPPRIAVAGLNPHAGESGALGREEIEIIAPAVERLSTLNPQCPTHFSAPQSPDTVFHRAANGEFDAVLCMYHDQGLIPLKLHAFDSGVNVTLGLPFPRTSPDHGTAFDIAGKGIARA